MKHLMLKFTYAVEIGANLAYLGHYQATKDPEVLRIALEEIEHKNSVNYVLNYYKQKPFFLFNLFFAVIGNIIKTLCLISPKPLLNYIARIMEVFAVFSYRKLSKEYPEFQHRFRYMAEAEERHEKYFTRG